LIKFKEAIQGISINELLKIKFEPVFLYILFIKKLNWNVIHMLSWYGREDILRDLISSGKVTKDILNFPDKVSIKLLLNSLIYKEKLK